MITTLVMWDCDANVMTPNLLGGIIPVSQGQAGTDGRREARSRWKIVGRVNAAQLCRFQLIVNICLGVVK